ncbi:MAG TPA: hypothetical protein VJ912_00070 [Candidatus Nanoarchaeia archaeon]|nr:hypothetical protein [Candidatus Nanoarchaeia archaeon]
MGFLNKKKKNKGVVDLTDSSEYAKKFRKKQEQKNKAVKSGFFKGKIDSQGYRDFTKNPPSQSRKRFETRQEFSQQDYNRQNEFNPYEKTNNSSQGNSGYGNLKDYGLNNSENTSNPGESEKSNGGIGGFLGGFFGGGSNTENSETQNPQNYNPEEKSVYGETVNPEEKRRRLTKRLKDMTERMESLSNELFHLQQRLELIERKLDIR